MEGKVCYTGTYTGKNGPRYSRPQPGCNQPSSLWPGITKLFPARESLVSDIPAGDGKIVHLFLQCMIEGNVCCISDRSECMEYPDGREGMLYL